MILPKINILEFALLPESRRSEYETIAKYIDVSDCVDCKNWRFIDVKEAIDLMNSELTYETIIDICKKNNKLIEKNWLNLYWYDFIALYHEIVKQLIEIVEIENASLGSFQPTAKQLDAGLEEFNIFSYYNQIRAVVKALGLTPKQVESMSWNEVFVELNYQRVESVYLTNMNKVK